MKEDWFEYFDSGMMVSTGGGGSFFSLFQPINSTLLFSTRNHPEEAMMKTFPLHTERWHQYLAKNDSWARFEDHVLETARLAYTRLAKRCPSIREKKPA